MTKTMTNGSTQLTSTPRPVTRTLIQLNSTHGPNMVTLWEDDQPTTPSTWTVNSSMSLDMPKVSPEIHQFGLRIEQLLKIGPLIQSLLTVEELRNGKLQMVHQSRLNQEIFSTTTTHLNHSLFHKNGILCVPKLQLNYFALHFNIKWINPDTNP